MVVAQPSRLQFSPRLIERMQARGLRRNDREFGFFTRFRHADSPCALPAVATPDNIRARTTTLHKGG